MFEAITKALTTVKETVSGINEEAQRAVATTSAVDKAVTRVVNTAQEEADKIGAAASKFMDGLKALAPKPEEEVTGSPAPSALETAAQLKGERVAMFAANEAGPADKRGPTDWRDRFSNRAGYQQEAEATAGSPAP